MQPDAGKRSLSPRKGISLGPLQNTISAPVFITARGRFLGAQGRAPKLFILPARLLASFILRECLRLDTSSLYMLRSSTH